MAESIASVGSIGSIGTNLMPLTVPMVPMLLGPSSGGYRDLGWLIRISTIRNGDESRNFQTR